jgi:hypothetical protein
MVIEGSEIKAEVNRKKDPGAAFGIFSSRASAATEVQGSPSTSAGRHTSSSFARGHNVSIINDTGSEADQERCTRLASLLIDNISEPSFDPSGFYDKGIDDETMKGAVLVRGLAGYLQRHTRAFRQAGQCQ